jgi:hypothetical protein
MVHDLAVSRPCEKGIRCKSGTVPAAVSSLNVVNLFCHCHALCGWEDLERQSKPEDLPPTIFLAFGKKVRNHYLKN